MTATELMPLVRGATVFLHVLAAAVAVGIVVHQDMKLLRSGSLDREALIIASQLVKVALGALWLTGIVIVAIDTNGVPGRVLEMPKLLAKLFVVLILTLNGALLHAFAFPYLTGPSPAAFSEFKLGLIASSLK